MLNYLHSSKRNKQFRDPNKEKKLSNYQARHFPFPFASHLPFPLQNVMFNEISMSRFSTIRARLSNIVGKSSSTSSMVAGSTASFLVLDSPHDSSVLTQWKYPQFLLHVLNNRPWLSVFLSTSKHFSLDSY